MNELRAGNRGGGHLRDSFAPCCEALGHTQRGTSTGGVALPLALLAPLPLDAQKKPTAKPKTPTAAKPAPLIPLTQQQRAQQLLNRFTFGARPGEVEQVLALT